MEFFEKIKPEIDSLREKFKDYPSLYFESNKEPIGYLEYFPRIEKRIINGLILAKWFQPNDYERLKTEYRDLFENYKGQDKEQVKLELETGFDYLDKNLIPAAHT